MTSNVWQHFSTYRTKEYSHVVMTFRHYHVLCILTLSLALWDRTNNLP